MIYQGREYRIISDHVGTPVAVVDVVRGKAIEELEFDEFGIMKEREGKPLLPFGFAGGLLDADTKLTHFGARDYDPETGRFISKDPMLFGGGDTNLYGYGLQDPVNMIDPSGLFTITINDPGGRNGATYGGTSTITSDSGHTITIPASSWPNPTNPSPGIAPGTYSATFDPTGHHGGPGIVINGNGQVPTIGPNPNQNGNSFADYIHIHPGASQTNRGSAGCPTTQPGTNPFQYLVPGETGTVKIGR